ncbi:MAG: hypothetical protein R3C69_16430 [Geminicoccaceae bacterium]
MAKLALGAFFLVALALRDGRPRPDVRTGAAWLVDAAVLLVAAVTFVAVRAMTSDAAACHRLRQCLAVALATPLLLGIAFKFLLVPLPREGLVVVALETVYFAARGAF